MKPQKISTWLLLDSKTEFVATIETPHFENEVVTMAQQNMLQLAANVAKVINAFFNHSKK